MKKAIYSILVAVAITFMVACGGGAPKVEQSAEMKEFVGMLKGKSADVSAALGKFATDELKNNDMSMYDLTDVVVTAKEGDCYTIEAKAGITTRSYKLCWSGGKINDIKDLGMK